MKSDEQLLIGENYPGIPATGTERKNPHYITSLDKVGGLPPPLKKPLTEVAKKFSFRANEYYLSLIDWKDPDDPIRKIIIPDPLELEDWGALDASSEKTYTVAPGVQHKYLPDRTGPRRGRVWRGMPLLLQEKTFYAA